MAIVAMSVRWAAPDPCPNATGVFVAKSMGVVIRTGLLPVLWVIRPAPTSSAASSFPSSEASQ